MAEIIGALVGALVLIIGLVCGFCEHGVAMMSKSLNLYHFENMRVLRICFAVFVCFQRYLCVLSDLFLQKIDNQNLAVVSRFSCCFALC